MTAIIILIAPPAVPLLRRWLLLHLAKNASDLGSSFQVSLPPPQLTAFCRFNCFVIDQEREINGEVKSEEMSRTRVVQTKPKIKRKPIQIQSSHLSHAIYVTVCLKASEWKPKPKPYSRSWSDRLASLELPVLELSWKPSNSLRIRSLTRAVAVTTASPSRREIQPKFKTWPVVAHAQDKSKKKIYIFN